MKSISSLDLSSVSGCVWRGPASSTSEAKKNFCTGPKALDHYNWMKDHMTPDNSEAPGVKRRVVAAVGQLCGWPGPGAATATPAPAPNAQRFLDTIQFGELSALAGSR